MVDDLTAIGLIDARLNLLFQTLARDEKADTFADRFADGTESPCGYQIHKKCLLIWW